MLRKLRARRPSHATAVAYLALFVALGGTAYAAATITGADVVDESLTGADIKGKSSPGFVDGTLDTYDIRNKSLLSSDVAANSLTAGELAPNSVSTSELKDRSVTSAKLAFIDAWGVPGPPVACSSTHVWGDFGSAAHYVGVEFRRDPYGVVHLRGAVQCPDPVDANHHVITRLPSGYAPTFKEDFPVASGDGFGNFVGAAIVEVAPDGSVTVSGNFDRRFISLSGIEYGANPGG